MATKTVTDASFDADVLRSNKPVLVDFWAAWCGPCRMVAPVVEQISAEYGDQIEVVKLDADQNPNTMAKYGITSLPTLCVFQGGKIVKTMVGAQPKSAIASALANFITAK